MKSENHGIENLRTLLDSICLRRTKKLLNLPETIYEDRRIDFSPVEKAYYAAVQTEKIATIKRNESQGRQSKNFFSMFQLHLQLRRVCNHGTFHKGLLTPAEEHQFEPGQAFDALKKERLAKCEYCRTKIVRIEELEDEGNMGKFSTCGHLFCTKCYLKYKKSLKTISEGVVQCSICTEKYSVAQSTSKNSELISNHNLRPHLHFTKDGVSSKVAALMHDIKNKSSEGKR